MPPKKKRNQKPQIGEHVRIAVDIKLQQFLNNHEQTELEFPNSLSSVERAYIHILVKDHGLKSKSKGKGDQRFLTIYKRDRSTIIQSDCSFNLTKASYQAIVNLLTTYPLSLKEKTDVKSETNSLRSGNPKVQHNKDFLTNPGRLNNGFALVPTLSYNPELKSFRDSLPISQYKSEILDLINGHQVILVSGETGSGKTTQIPQFILDEASTKNQCCRIICTQPRRISAVSVCERVAYERGVQVGQDVGYQIRLESRVSPQTGLIYCTTGVLLRTLMGSNKSFSNITHVIIDEIHERDKFTDYLLIVLRDSLPKNPSLKLILMSATMDTKVFTKYFNNCPFIEIPGRLFPVKSYFLEDILQITNYSNKDMQRIMRSLKDSNQNKKNDDWASQFRNMHLNESHGSENVADNSSEPEPENDLKDIMDQSLAELWMNGSPHYYGQILHLILNENVSVNYQHRSIGCTILMVCAGRGFVDQTEHILSLGANTKLRSNNNWTAYDWALNFGQKECADLIVAYSGSLKMSNEIDNIQRNIQSDEVKKLLEAYSYSFNSDDEVDHDLILHVIKFLHSNQDDGGILVFLPGYEDIVNLRDLIIRDEKLQERPYQLFILHSNMQTIDHKQVFKKLIGIRKIILSTNIAQTSVTIDDVVYVVDSGKVKEISFDGISNTTCLRANWVSKACAMQRAGRAGRVRPGLCFHLFSSARYNEVMKPFTTPDILRTPLQELCLQTKLLAPVEMSIADFLQKAIDSPPAMITKQAVALLKTMGALDNSEELTELGMHLVNTPLEPRLSKMIMYGVIFKCLDPILTIACCLAHKEPFVIPTQTFEKRTLANVRKDFSAGTFSDHMMLLQIFQAWQKSRQGKYERQFSTKNFVNSATMEQILNTRTQLLGHLRASGFVKAKGHYDIKYLNVNSDNWPLIKAAMVASSYPSMCRLDREYMTLRTQNETKVGFHPSSSLKTEINFKHKPSAAQVEFLNKVPSEWMIFEEKSRVGPWCFIRIVTFVSPITVALFGGPIRNTSSMITKTPVVELSSESDSESEHNSNRTSNTKTFAVDDWARFEFDDKTADCIYDLRRKWNALFLRRLINPSKAMSAADEAVLNTVIKVLTEEDLKAGFVQPVGIGQRPLSTEDMTPAVYQNFSNKDTCSAKNNISWRDRQSKPSFNRNNDRICNVKYSKYFLYKMDHGKDGTTMYRYKQIFTVNQKFAMLFHRILQNHGRVYIIFLSANKMNFDGVAEVKSSVSGNDRNVQLNWLSRLHVPIAGSGFGTTVNVSVVSDGIELEDEFGKTLMDYLINYKPSYHNSAEKYYVQKN